MPKLYDSIIIGAGIAGCCSAYMLQQKGQKVLLVDKSCVAASGGSGAAGAFVSPKIGKGSALQELTNEAFEFAKDFYLKNFPEYFHQTGVIRIPKDTDDAQKFKIYEKFNDSRYRWVDKDELESIGIKSSDDSFCFEEAGVCDAPEICEAMQEQIEYMQIDVESLEHDGNYWLIHKEQLKSKNIILATGYQNNLFDMRYMGVRGTWGTRGDFYSSLDLNVSMHKDMSVGANMHGVIRLGATHEKEVKSDLPCKKEYAESLKKKASAFLETKDLKLKEVFCGMRAGSRDYFPLVGQVIDTDCMLKEYPSITRGAKIPFKHIKNQYVCNGLGGRGFVFAPMMAKLLAELIVDKKEIDMRVNPDRLFLKWCRKL